MEVRDPTPPWLKNVFMESQNLLASMLLGTPTAYFRNASDYCFKVKSTYSILKSKADPDGLNVAIPQMTTGAGFQKAFQMFIMV